jgi:alpha-amylase
MTEFGTAQDLHDLVAAAHARDIWVMLDVVANHSSYYALPDFSNIYPFNQSSDYHPYCTINNWSDQWQIENCWAWGLPDHDQGNQYVRNYLLNWVHDVVQTYNFDGIRIDTVQEVPRDFWQEYNPASGVFQMGECYNEDPSYVGYYQPALTALFNYPMYFTIKNVYAYGHSMFEIRQQYDTENGTFTDVDALGSFVDNHDNPRFLSLNSNWALFKSALTFGMTARGIPFFYYGDEQGFNGGNDPYCRESLWNAMNTNADIYQYVAKINKARKSA